MTFDHQVGSLCKSEEINTVKTETCDERGVTVTLSFDSSNESVHRRHRMDVCVEFEEKPYEALQRYLCSSIYYNNIPIDTLVESRK